MSKPNKPFSMEYRGHLIVFSGDELQAEIFHGDTLRTTVCQSEEIDEHGKPGVVTSMVAMIRWLAANPWVEPVASPTSDEPLPEDED